MAWKALGVVTVTAGTPIPVQSLVPANSRESEYQIHGIMFLRHPENSGLIAIGDSAEEMDVSSLEHCYGYLDENIRVLTGTLTIAPNGLNLRQYFIDGDTNGDKTIISVLVT